MKVVVAALFFPLAVSISSGVEDSPEVKETTVALRLVHALIEAQEELFDERPELPKKPLTLREFSKSLSKEIAKRMVHRDGWGNEFMVFVDGRGAFVASAGENRIHDTISFLTENDESEERDEKETIYGDDIVLVYGERIVNGALSQRKRQKRTMADLRSIGTAIEEFSIDHEVYPLQDRGLLPVEGIRELLSPVYIRDLPLRDGWENEILMWGTEEEYVVISLGADGVPDRNYGIVEGSAKGTEFRGATSDFDDDIVFWNGQFVQWPEGTQR